MAFDFTTLTNRDNTDSLKWDVKPGELPMWVADMDFPAAAPIKAEMQRVLDGGIYGYTIASDAWRDVVSTWWSRRHGLAVNPKTIHFSVGVVATVASAIRALTNVGENVVLSTPAYNCFFRCILENGRCVLENPLIYDGTAYRMDFANLEECFANPQTSLYILCNPHNPTGNLWSADDLARIGELAARYDVIVISDEIHGDIVRPGMSTTSFAAVNDTCASISVTCSSPTKTFNIAGLNTSYFFSNNARLVHRINRQLATDNCTAANVFSCAATIGAYSEEGAAWVDAVREVIQQNKDMVAAGLAREFPDVHPCASDATYLLWLDCSAVTDDSDKLQEFLRAQTGLYVSKGSIYGEAGRTFLRMNVGTQPARVEDGLVRLITGLKAF